MWTRVVYSLAVMFLLAARMLRSEELSILLDAVKRRRRAT